jgi:hypothetical protein
MSWILRDRVAISEVGNWLATVDLGNSVPVLSIKDKAVGAIKATFAIAPIERAALSELDPLALTEAYVRQSDFIAQYTQCDPWRFGYQIDFRNLELPEERNAIGIEIWLSVQTALLDSNPQLEVNIRGSQLRLSDDPVLLDQTNRLGILVHPMDKDDCCITTSGSTSTMKIFGRFMEKGVIRRMRFRVIAAAQEPPTLFWKKQFTDFAASPLPLTT